MTSLSEKFLIAMTLIFSLPYLVWRVANRDLFAPLVVVQIGSGILLGPAIAGTYFPKYYALVFSPEVLQSLSGIALWAAMIFVWIAGIELDLKRSWEHRLETGVTALLALGAPLVLGILAGALLLTHTGWAGVDSTAWQFLAAIGMACAVTALPVLIIFMEKLEILQQPMGQRLLRYASLDDIAIWIVLALILMNWELMGRQIAFLLAFAVASYFVRWVMVRLAESDRWSVALIWLVLCGLAADWSGLHSLVGAFLAGAILESHWFDQGRLNALRHNVMLFVMPVFFLSTGLRTEWTGGGIMVFAAAGLLLTASIFGKLLGMQLAGKILRWESGEGMLLGWLLQTKGLVMIVFASVLLDKHIISGDTFTALLLMAVGSTMLTMPMVIPRLERSRAIVLKAK